MRGKFITFEGIEGCGKTTQIKLLDEYLRKKGFETVLSREPGGTKIGDKIRAILLDPEHKEMTPLAELFLYEASRAQHVNELINPAVESGKVILCDRFADSSAAYQSAARLLPKDLVDELNNIAIAGIKPDLTVILDINPEEGLKRAHVRGKPDRFEQEKMDFHERVRNGYLALAKKEPKRFIVINGRKTVEEIHKEIISCISSAISLK
ncbi:MAG: dTMP kinase [Deltaproteobacteria bacterium]|nr:dTMP kinase [Deltaproteobacteria bacterium]MBI2974770.1 dTMP kinase [Deltaproteobacteria bacterium]